MRPKEEELKKKLELLVAEVEARVVRTIKSDLELGYQPDMVLSKINGGSYVGNSLVTFSTHKKFFPNTIL